MLRPLAAIAAALWLAACVAGLATAERPPDVARAYEDLSGAQPANLVRVARNDLVGRSIQSTGSTLHTIHYVLADPNTGAPRYVLASANDPGSYLMIPLSALQVTPGGSISDASHGRIGQFPEISQTYMEHRFRPAE
jgi:hypothetical protein